MILRILLVASLLLTACGLPGATGGSGGASGAAPIKLRVAYLQWGILPAVKSRGTLDQALAADGVSVEWVGPFPAFAPLLEVLNGGGADLSAGGDIPALSGLAGEVPICFLGARAPQVEAEAILVRKDSSIRSVADLAGKKVAVNRGGWGEDMLLRALDRAATPKDRVEPVYLGPTDALAAFAQGGVDAWAVWDPFVAIAEVDQQARRIASGDVAPHYGLYVTRNAFLAAHVALVEKVMGVLQREGEWVTQNPAAAAVILGRELKLPDPVSKRMAEHLPGESIGPVDTKVQADLQRSADWLYSVGASPRRVNVQSAVCPVQVKR